MPATAYYKYMPLVMVLDDNADIRSSLCTLLDKAGYETVALASAKDAAEIHSTRPVDLIITDLFMPDTDGLELIRRFKREFVGVRIIAISGGGTYGLESLLSVAKQMGADRIFSKPVEWHELLAAIEELVPRPTQ